MASTSLFAVFVVFFAGCNARMSRWDYWDGSGGTSVAVPAPVGGVEILTLRSGNNAMYKAVALIIGEFSQNGQPGWTSYCSGTSIVPPGDVQSDKAGLFVLTAAHCVWDQHGDAWFPYTELKVHFGVHDGQIYESTEPTNPLATFDVVEAVIPRVFPDMIKRWNSDWQWNSIHVMYDYAILRLKPRTDGKTPPHSLPLGVFKDETQRTTLLRAGYSKYHNDVYEKTTEERGHLTVFLMQYIKDDVKVNPPGFNENDPDLNPQFGDKNKGVPVWNFIV